MPLIGKDIFHKAPYEHISADDSVYYCEETGEVFSDYDQFFDRILLVNSHVWGCSITGKNGLLYKDADESEEKARDELKQLPISISRGILALVSVTEKTNFGDLYDDLFSFLKDRYFQEEVIFAALNEDEHKMTKVKIEEVKCIKPEVKVVAPVKLPLKDGADLEASDSDDDVCLANIAEQERNPHPTEYLYTVRRLNKTEDSSGEDDSEVESAMSSPSKAALREESVTISCDKLRRPRHLLTKERLKLFLRFTCNPDHSTNRWVVSKHALALFNLKFLDSHTSVTEDERKSLAIEAVFCRPIPHFKASTNIKRVFSASAHSSPMRGNAGRPVGAKSKKKHSTPPKDKKSKGSSEGPQINNENKAPGHSPDNKQTSPEFSKDVLSREALKELQKLEKEELKKRLTEQKANMAKERQQVRDRLKEEKRLAALKWREYSKIREDLEVDDMVPLPDPVIITNGDLFSKYVAITEFVHSFSDLLDPEKEVFDDESGTLPLVTLQNAVASNDSQGLYHDLVQLLIGLVLRLQEEELEGEYDMNESDKPIFPCNLGSAGGSTNDGASEASSSCPHKYRETHDWLHSPPPSPDASMHSDDDEEAVPKKEEETDNGVLENGSRSSTPPSYTNEYSSSYAKMIRRLEKKAFFFRNFPGLVFGLPLSDLIMSQLSLTEILRLHLLSSPTPLRLKQHTRGGYTHLDDPAYHVGRNNTQLLQQLCTTPLYDLTEASKLEVIQTLIDQCLTHIPFRAHFEDNMEQMKDARQQLKDVQFEKLRWIPNVKTGDKKRGYLELVNAVEKTNSVPVPVPSENGEATASAPAPPPSATTSTIKKLSRKELQKKTDFIQKLIAQQLQSEAEVDDDKRSTRNARKREATISDKDIDVFMLNGLDAEVLAEFSDLDLTVVDRAYDDARLRAIKALETNELQIGAKIAMLSYANATHPIGLDRAYRRYWLFASLGGLFVEDVSGELPQPDYLVTTHPHLKDVLPQPMAERWGVFYTADQLTHLLTALTPRGFREADLSSVLMRKRRLVEASMAACPVELLEETCAGKDGASNGTGRVIVHKARRRRGLAGDASSSEKLELLLREQILDFEEQVHCGSLGSLNVSDRQVWRDAVGNGSFDACTPILFYAGYKPIYTNEIGSPLPAAPKGLPKLEKENGANGHSSPRSSVDTPPIVNVSTSVEESLPPVITNGYHQPQDNRSESGITSDQPSSIAQQRSSTSNNTSHHKDMVRSLACAVLQLEQGIDSKYLQGPLCPDEKSDETAVNDFCADRSLSRLCAKQRSSDNGKNKSSELSSLPACLPTILDRWESVLFSATSLSQVALHLSSLKSSVRWDRSVLKARCKVCRKKCDPEKMLLCDLCDAGYHMYCLKPALKKIPEGDWHCKSCKPRVVRSTPTANKSSSRFTAHQFTEEDTDDSDFVAGRNMRKKTNAAVIVSESEDEEGDNEEDDVAEEEDEEGSGDNNDSEADGSDNEESAAETEATSTAASDDDDADEPTEFVCNVCNEEDTDNSNMLHCGSCESDFHVECVGFMRKPRGNWKCQACSSNSASSRNGVKPDSDPYCATSSRKRTSTGVVKATPEEQFKAAEEIVKTLTKHEDAWPFLKPVSKKQVPDYFDVIKSPMSFAQIQTKIRNFSYHTDASKNDNMPVLSMIADVQLILDNCFVYNPPDTEVHASGKILLDLFYQKLDEATLPRPKGATAKTAQATASKKPRRG